MDDATSRARSEALIRAFMDETWNRSDPSRVDDFLTADYVDHAYEPPDAAGLKKQMNELARAFPDHHTRVEDCLVEGDRVVMRMRLTATHQGPFRGAPASGNLVDVNLVRWFRLSGERIAEHWALLDTAALLRQIGAGQAPGNACKA